MQDETPDSASRRTPRSSGRGSANKPSPLNLRDSSDAQLRANRGFNRRLNVNNASGSVSLVSNGSSVPGYDSAQPPNGSSDMQMVLHKPSNNGLPASPTPGATLQALSTADMMTKMDLLNFQLGSVTTQNSQLRHRIQELEAELAEARKNSSITPTLTIPSAQSSASPFKGIFGPQTPPPPSGVLVTPGAPRYSSFRGKRHARTATPDQRSVSRIISGLLSTPGINPQGDRPMLNDFFDIVYEWGHRYTVPGSPTIEQAQGMAILAVVKDFLPMATTADLMPYVTDEKFRCALVVAIITRDVTFYTFCESFMYNSGHPDSEQCEKLLEEWAGAMSEGNIDRLQDLLFNQKCLYTNIKQSANYHEWRGEQAWSRAGVIIEKLGLLLHDNHDRVNGDMIRQNVLNDIYIKGYRIGFRFRSEAVKWSVTWPLSGDEFNNADMVNQSINLLGDVGRTMQRTHERPYDFIVRFARTPKVVKTEYSTGSPNSETIHKSEVFLAEKHGVIGAERSRLIQARQSSTTFR